MKQAEIPAFQDGDQVLVQRPFCKALPGTVQGEPILHPGGHYLLEVIIQGKRNRVSAEYLAPGRKQDSSPRNSARISGKSTPAKPSKNRGPEIGD